MNCPEMTVRVEFADGTVDRAVDLSKTSSISRSRFSVPIASTIAIPAKNSEADPVTTPEAYKLSAVVDPALRRYGLSPHPQGVEVADEQGLAMATPMNYRKKPVVIDAVELIRDDSRRRPDAC